MTSTNEVLTFDSVALNGGSPWSLEAFTFSPASKRLQRLSAADADADILAEVARHDLRIGTARIRYEGGAGMDAFLTAVNDLSGRLQRAEELADGSPLVWTPATSTHTSTIFVQSGEITDLPMELDGDNSGWFASNPRPVITVRFDCFPFLEKAEYLAATVSGSDRVLTVPVTAVGGTVPAKVRAVMTDTASATRRHVEVGGDRYGYNAAAPSDMDITATEMTALAGTLSGSYITYDVSNAPIGICEHSTLPHVGPHNLRAQVERVATGVTLRVRAAVRTVDGPWKYTPWRTLPNLIGKFDVLLGQVDFDVVERGAQLSTVRLEAVAVGAATLRVYRVNPFPTEVVYAVMRSRVSSAPPTSFPVFDQFNQSAGNLAGKTQTGTAGGTWAGTGDAEDFAVEATGHTAQRTAVSDSSISNGRFAQCGTTTYTDVTVQADVKFSAATAGTYTFALLGPLARYSSTSLWIAAGLCTNGFFAVYINGAVAGWVYSPYFAVLSHWYKVKLTVTAKGEWFAWVASAASDFTTEPTLSGQDSTLATGGSTAIGKVGLYDVQTSVAANTRNYDNFLAAAPTEDVPLYSGRSLEIAHGHAIRENSGGTGWARVPSYRGRHLWLPPQGPGSLPTRLVFKDRLNDVDGGDVDSADSARTVYVYVTERTIAVP